VALNEEDIQKGIYSIINWENIGERTRALGAIRSILASIRRRLLKGGYL
jgi:hypothetical protein